MPYADVEKRRRFQKQYKAKWRGRQAKINPLLAFKVFISVRYPDLPLGGGAYFRGGLLVTDDLWSQNAVRRHPEYLRSIFPLLIDFDCVPLKEGEEF
ncbi:MAG: hypothetical protein ACLP2P_15495 [Desulfobaccales bacterium]